MTGVLVKDGSGNVVTKMAFAGDESVVPQRVADLQAKNPTYSYEIYKDTDANWDVVFVKTTIAKVLDSDWQIAKTQGAAAALTFIAKKLGLE